MRAIKCTCIYRGSTEQEREQGATAIVIEVADFECPARTFHEKYAKQESK